MCVTSHILRHNHEISKEIYEDYPEVRKTKNKSMLKTVEAMYAHVTPRTQLLAAFGSLTAPYSYSIA